MSLDIARSESASLDEIDVPVEGSEDVWRRGRHASHSMRITQDSTTLMTVSSLVRDDLL